MHEIDQRPRCGAERSGTWPCVRILGECQGAHNDKLGRTWSDQDNIKPALRCTAVPPAERSLCVVQHRVSVKPGDEVPHVDLYGKSWTTTEPTPKLTIHTAGELHPAPPIEGRITFTYNLSDLLDDPAHKPGGELIDLDGTHVDVQDFVFMTDGALELFEDIIDTIARQLRRKSVTVLILCRGGKHRSVAFGEALAHHFDVTVTHHHKHLDRVTTND